MAISSNSCLEAPSGAQTPHTQPAPRRLVASCAVLMSTLLSTLLCPKKKTKLASCPVLTPAPHGRRAGGGQPAASHGESANPRLRELEICGWEEFSESVWGVRGGLGCP